MADFPQRVRIVEVGARDGLQNEPRSVQTDIKISLIDRLSAAGFPVIEAGAFVSPRWVPQMADSAAVLAGIERRAGVRYPVLVPNLRGMEEALAAGARDIAVFAAASESFSRRNINCSIEESIARFAPVAELASAHGVALRGYVSCVMGCPYEGEIAPAAVARVATALQDLGCTEISLGDTIGTGTPLKTRRLVEEVTRTVPLESLALHLHDTYGQALVNLHAGLAMGITTIDSSIGGLGGCPYAPGASGNVATEDVLLLLRGLDIATDIDFEAALEAGWFICDALGRTPQSKASQAFRVKRVSAKA
ncbi:MAG TPA: hydroxymethylglutaryl-CoA lyase [Dongiaceae bacterium]|jgi:hydroxymethylglutaryl-CoA lyase|nr:hydroxymethylglutaryl-CoA lyase [Dongiaceae bacterium]